MRIHPILDWTYAEVWNFLLALRVPYCHLYDLGYTSIGLQDDTIPNPRLRTIQGHYLPAHRLTEASEERLGRQRSPKL